MRTAFKDHSRESPPGTDLRSQNARQLDQAPALATDDLPIPGAAREVRLELAGKGAFGRSRLFGAARGPVTSTGCEPSWRRFPFPSAPLWNGLMLVNREPKRASRGRLASGVKAGREARKWLVECS